MFYKNYPFSHTQSAATDNTNLALSLFLPYGGYIQGIYASYETLTSLVVSMVNGATITPFMNLFNADINKIGATRANPICIPSGTNYSLRFTSVGTPTTGNFTIMINYFAFPSPNNLCFFSQGTINDASPTTIYTNLSTTSSAHIKSINVYSAPNASTDLSINFSNTVDTVTINNSDWDLSTNSSLCLKQASNLILNTNDYLQLEVDGSTNPTGYIISGNFVG